MFSSVTPHSQSTSSTSSSSRTNSPLTDLASPSYLHYTPGLHSIAGPLPPPPRANFDIDIHNPPPPRPPRLHSPAPTRSKRGLDAVKQNLQLPPSVTTVLSSKSSNLTTTKLSKEDLSSHLSDINDPSSESELPTTTSVHRREGAFSPLDDIPADDPASVIATTTSPLESSNIEIKETAKEAVQVLDTASIPSVTVVKPPSHPTTSPAEIHHQKFSEWLKANPELSQPQPLETRQRHSSVDQTHEQRLSESSERSISKDSGGRGTDVPSPPPKSFRNSLTTNLNRLSLPRTASVSSKSGRRWSGARTQSMSRTPSPSLHRVSPPPLRFQKIRSTNPAALFCHEIHSQRTTSERCLIYATKINELYLYDCGLSEWVIDMKSRGPNAQHQRSASDPQPFEPQPRHTSRSSMISEATFPRRPDASTATDLSQGTYGDITPTSVSLTLPYPSLAMNPPRTNPSRSNSSVGTPSIRSLTSSASISRTGGFFASLGRKTSLSRKERANNNNNNNILIPPSSGSLSSPLGSGRLLSTSSKHSPLIPLMNKTISRPITNPPSIPGGPRAPPHRNHRHILTPSFPPASTAVNGDLGRRPSMLDLTLDPVLDIHADPEFYQQVDKLASVLPHADRDVLAGYLRRAGLDMLALGQYLEDEKNGTIRRYE